MEPKRRAELCAILGLESTVTEEELKRKYYSLAREHHPDNNPDNQQEATEKFQEISNAYEILTNKQKDHQINEEESFGDFGFHFGFGGHFHQERGSGFDDFIRMMFFEKMMRQNYGHGFFDEDEEDYYDSDYDYDEEDDDYHRGPFGFGGSPFGFFDSQRFNYRRSKRHFGTLFNIKTPKLQAYSFDITWKKPVDYPQVEYYQVSLENEYRETNKVVYEGKETFTSVDGLESDCPYTITINAFDSERKFVISDTQEVYTNLSPRKKKTKEEIDAELKQQRLIKELAKKKRMEEMEKEKKEKEKLKAKNKALHEKRLQTNKLKKEAKKKEEQERLEKEKQEKLMQKSVKHDAPKTQKSTQKPNSKDKQSVKVDDALLEKIEELLMEDDELTVKQPKIAEEMPKKQSINKKKDQKKQELIDEEDDYLAEMVQLQKKKKKK